MEIMVYAKVNGCNQFIGVFDSLDSLHAEVTMDLDNEDRLDLKPYVHFAIGDGKEYRLFMGARNND